MIDFCNYQWTNVMEGNRIIHPLYPYQYYGIEDTVMVGENEVLELKVKDNPRDVKYWDGTIYHPKWEVPLLKSVESFSYGTFSIEAQLPKGKGLWASLWLTGRDVWPPEIDILEGESDRKGSYFRMFQSCFPHVWPTYRTTTNVHYRLDGEKQNIGQKNVSVFTIQNPTEYFVKYECVWTPSSIIIKYVGKTVRKITDEKIIAFFNAHPQMNFVINVFLDSDKGCTQTTPMKVRNFSYEEL